MEIHFLLRAFFLAIIRIFEEVDILLLEQVSGDQVQVQNTRVLEDLIFIPTSTLSTALLLFQLTKFHINSGKFAKQKPAFLFYVNLYLKTLKFCRNAKAVRIRMLLNSAPELFCFLV